MRTSSWCRRGKPGRFRSLPHFSEGTSERSANCRLRGHLKAGYDDCDIVFPAVFVGLGDKTFASRPWLLGGFKDGGDAFVGQHIRQAIGTEQQHVIRVQHNAVTLHEHPRLMAADSVGNDVA